MAIIQKPLLLISSVRIFHKCTKLFPTSRLTLKRSCATDQVTNSSDVSNSNSQSSTSISYELMQQMLVDEEYQSKVGKVMRIIYSVDETQLPQNISYSTIDHLVKMKNERAILSHLKRLKKLEQEEIERNLARKKANLALALNSNNVIPHRELAIFEHNGSLAYKFNGNSCLCKYQLKQRLRNLIRAKVCRGYFLDEPKVIFDFGYEKHITLKQILVMSAELKKLFTIISKMKEHVALYFCNFDAESATAKVLDKDFAPDLEFIFKSSNSYLDLFPKEKLVYLTAHTDNVLEYNPTDIYIIGGMVDIGTKAPLSAIKAEQEGLRMARLPQELLYLRNLEKSLNMSQVFGIICDLIDEDKDLVTALDKNIPAFKKVTADEATNYIAKTKIKSQKRREVLQNKYNLSEEELLSIRAFSYFWK